MFLLNLAYFPLLCVIVFIAFIVSPMLCVFVKQWWLNLTQCCMVNIMKNKNNQNITLKSLFVELFRVNRKLLML